MALGVSLSLPSCGETVARVLGGGSAGWDGWTVEGKAWGSTDMPRLGNPAESRPHMESLASGESQTGALRSPSFTVKEDFIRFWVNGWDGEKGGKRVNGFFLKLATDGTIVRRALPPVQDGFQVRSWIVSDLVGREVYFEAVDGDTGGAFAWLGLAQVEEVHRAYTAAQSRYRAIPISGLGTWAVIERDGGGRETAPYLSSLGGGETGSGTIESPEFTVNVPKIRLYVRGHDGKNGGMGDNRVELISIESGKVLRSSPPPLSDFPSLVEWDVADLSGQKVKLRLVDGISENGFAWLGLDEFDAGDAFHVTFSDNRSLADWKSQTADPSYVERGGIPFLASPVSAVPMNGAVRIPLGVRASHLFLLGMTNSADRGCPVWGDPRDVNSRFFLGDKLGRVRLEYADGTTQDYPLILGESLWWGKRFFQFPEPFASDPHAQKVLEASLRLYPRRPLSDGYMAVVTPRLVPIKALVVEHTSPKMSAPVLTGLTVEPMPGESIPGGIALPSDVVPADAQDFIRRMSLRPEGTDEQSAREKLDDLRKVLYVSEEDFIGEIKPDIPEGYRGPRVRFHGTPYAEVLANIYHNNLHDMAGRVDATGMYHTSAKDAPSWGGYEGFGTFTKTAGSYYGHSWSRDMGRTLQEIVDQGYIEEGLRCAEYCFRSARAWSERPDLKLNGVALPPHWCRILNLPSPNDGCFENDGHAFTTMFIYKLWQRLPDRDEWLRDHWTDMRAAGDWILWQFAHPEISGATDVLRTDSECAGGVGNTVYADVACMEALRALAEMADSIGEKGAAAQWRNRASLMQSAIPKAYVVSESGYGKVWTLDHSGWPNRSTVLGPIIAMPDGRGFDPAEDDTGWGSINEAAYRRLIDAYKPFGFYGTAMGYGQGFVTQSALLLDRMNDATTMLDWAARATYYPGYKPYIVPEGCEVEPGGRFWFRTGDLGNGVQQAEIVKAIRIVLGIDDAHPKQLRLFPRMPHKWTTVHVEDYPVLVEIAGRPRTAHLRYTLTRTEGGMILQVAADASLGTAQIRLGPFAKSPKASDVRLDGRQVKAVVERSGDSYWVRLAAPVSSHGSKVEIR